MPIKKDDHQDDYYAQVTQSSHTDDGEKKPVKLKLKVVAKKATEDEVVPKKEEVQTQPVRPTARLVEREHASE